MYVDFRGAMFKKRVEADKQLRDYYNTELKDLLGGTIKAHDMIRNIRCAVPWVVV